MLMESLGETAGRILVQMYEEVHKAVDDMLKEMDPAERVRFFDKLAEGYCGKCGETTASCDCS